MKKNKGFTLIELLVVIAIIGVLASVVLASLNTARNKGADAAVKSNLANVRAQAEMFYDTNSTYSGVCAVGATTINAGVKAAAVAAGLASPTVIIDGTVQSATTANCYATASAWAASVKLKNGSLYACVDSTGAAKDTTLLPVTTAVCQ
jgi:prepilin-type N-terminal cleavage/methylation domain-containing protein